jgi:hypothetical protein
MEELTVYDFYYSQKQYECSRRLAEELLPRRKFIHCYFKGQPFTECIEAGKKSSSLWDDFILVGTGTTADAIYE